MKNCIPVFLLMLSASSSYGRPGKLAPDLPEGTAEFDVIVSYSKPPSATHANRILAKGGRMKARFENSKSAAITIRGSALADLAADPDVVYIAPDRPLWGELDVSRSSIGAFTAQSYGWTGAGIGVAIIDSGTPAHADLQSRVVYSESFVPGTPAADVWGHGSHVAGIVAGGGVKSATYKGIAPGAHLVILKALGDNGAGKDSWVIAAINRAIQLKSTYNIRVLNLSLGRPVRESYLTDPLCKAVEAAWKAGIFVVTSAGNQGRNNSAGTSGYGTITSPGNHPIVITVGAVKTLGTASTADDAVASYSSKGPTLFDQVVKPDLVAPGNRVVSLDLGGKKASALVHDYKALKVDNET